MGGPGLKSDIGATPPGKASKFEAGGTAAPNNVAPPDLTDEQLRKRRAAEMQRLLSGKGRGSTFLTGTLGDTSAAPTAKKTLLGG